MEFLKIISLTLFIVPGKEGENKTFHLAQALGAIKWNLCMA